MNSGQDPEELLGIWLKEYRPVFFKIAGAFAPAAGADEADLIQEMMVRVWRSISFFRGQCKPSTWIYRVCLNTALTWRRDARRRQSFLRAVASFSPEAAADLPRPGQTHERTELVEQLYGAIRMLSADERTLVVLWLEELSYRDISEITGLTENYVGVALTRIRQKLGEILEGVRHEL